MLMIMIPVCILVASLAGAGLIASAQTAHDEADEMFPANPTEAYGPPLPKGAEWLRSTHRSAPG